MAPMGALPDGGGAAAEAAEGERQRLFEAQRVASLRWEEDLKRARQAEIDRMYGVDPLKMQHLLAGGQPLKSKSCLARFQRCLTKYVCVCTWRGFPPMRRVTTHPRFEQVIYAAILLNMYVMTVSNVQTGPCMYTYKGFNNDGLAGQLLWPPPSSPPSPQPSGLPTLPPTPLPTTPPSLAPSPAPSVTLSPTEPSQVPTPLPTDGPSQVPTPLPTLPPSGVPSAVPVPLPTPLPSATFLPSPLPSQVPSPPPSVSHRPSPQPTSPAPSLGPSPLPSATLEPTTSAGLRRRSRRRLLGANGGGDDADDDDADNDADADVDAAADPAAAANAETAAVLRRLAVNPAVVPVGGCVRGAVLDEGGAWYRLCDAINDLCALVFAGELLLNFVASGFPYFRPTFTKFDTLVVVVCVVDIFEPLYGAAAARFFRVANIVSKTTRVESLRRIVLSIQRSLGPLSGVVALVFLFLFVFAVGALQLYGLALPNEDRLNFRDFPHAMMAVFIMFTGDGWAQIMYKVVDETGESNALFFIIFVVYGLFGLSMLVLATLISKFDCGSKEDMQLSNVLPVNAVAAWAKELYLSCTQGSKKKRARLARELADLRARGLAPPEDVDDKAEEEEKKRLKQLEEEEKEAKKKAKEEKVQSPREILVEATKQAYFVQKNHTILKDHPSVIFRACYEATAAQIALDNAVPELSGPIGYWKCKIEPDGGLRTNFLNKVVDRPVFEGFILFCIFMSCGMLAYEGPGLSESDPLYAYLAYGDLALLFVFVTEATLRILHKGFLFTNVAYLRDPWNQLDFFIVCSDVVSTVFSGMGGSLPNIRGLRGFRALRPLRALKKAPELRAVVDVIANCIPVFLNLALCCLVFYLVSGVLMMRLFAGRFWQCNDPSVTSAEECGGYFRLGEGSPASGAGADDGAFEFPNATQGDAYRASSRGGGGSDYVWSNKHIEWSQRWEVGVFADGEAYVARKWFNAPRNFDSTAAAMLTLFEMSTLDHWVEVLYLCMDSPDTPGAQPAGPGARWGTALIVFSIIILGNYLLMNLLVCGVVVVYDRLKDDSKHNPTLTRGQREFLDAINLMLRTRPGYQQRPPEKDDYFGLRWRAYQLVMFDLSARLRGGDQRGSTFEFFVSFLVVLNTITMSAYYFNGPGSGEYVLVGSAAYDELQATAWTARLDLINDGFSSIFIVELLVKLFAFGPRGYWHDGWNKFDLVVVGMGLVQTCIDGFMGFELVPTAYTESVSGYLLFDPKTLRVLRVVRLVRVVRLLKGLNKWERVQSLTQLVDTLSHCLTHVINVFGLWLLVTFTFVLISMTLFGTIPWNDNEVYHYGAFGYYANFDSFFPALMTLFKVATLDNWVWLMRDLMEAQRQQGEAPLAWAFFVIYIIITAFLFLNIFTAIVMDQYDFTARVTAKPRHSNLPKQIMTFNQASTVSEEWSYLDPDRSDFIDEHRVRKLLAKIGPPVGFRPEWRRDKQLRHLRRMELRMTGLSRQVHYVDFFLSCCVLRYRLQRKPQSDIDLTQIRGKVALEIQIKFPTIMDARLDDSAGLLAPIQACYYIQGQYRGLVLRRLRQKGDLAAIEHYTENRLKQIELQNEKRAREDEEAARAAKKASGKDDKGKKGKKKGKKKK